jgi:hypothetical protein
MAITMWSVLLVDFSGPGVRDRLGKVKGTDFLQFYVAGSQVRDGRTDLLYDFSAQHERMQSVAGGGDDIVYVPIQSPQLALAFAPLARYSYQMALAIWLAVSIALYALACWIAWRAAGGLRGHAGPTVACCAAFPALYETVLHGQTSALSALLVVVALFALQRGHRFLAGVAFGCLAFKPHWAVAAGAIFVVTREWRVTAGIVLAASLQVGAAWLALGPDVMHAYWLTLRSVQQIGELLEPRPGHTFRGLFAALIPSPQVAFVLYASAAAITLVATARLWRSHLAVELRYSAIVLALILVSPHAFEYDLMLLVPVFFMLANWLCMPGNAAAARSMNYLLPALFVAPLLAVLPAAVRLQFSVTVMALILAFMWRQARSWRADAAGDFIEAPHERLERTL